MYEPWHKKLRFPPCGPYLATSNISPNNKVNTRYNGQFSEKALFASSSRQIQQIDKAVHTSTSSSEPRQERLGGRNGPSVGSIARLMIQEEASSGEMSRNALFKQWREREMDRGLSGERNRCGKKASSRRRGSNHARAWWYEYCWKRGSDNQQVRKDFWRDVECYRSQFEWSCNFRWWAGWGIRGEWWGRYRARQAEDDDKPGSAMGTISKTVQHHMGSDWQKPMRHDKLTQPVWGDAANYCCGRDMKIGTAELMVPAVVKPQIDMTTATPSPTTFGERMQTLAIVHGQSQIHAVTS